MAGGRSLLETTGPQARRTPCFSPPALPESRTACSAPSLLSTASTATKSRTARSSLLVVYARKNRQRRLRLCRFFVYVLQCRMALKSLVSEFSCFRRPFPAPVLIVPVPG